MLIPHFADIDWYFDAASQALMTGQLPTLGITASITWLHQGPLWIYLLLLPTALSISPVVFTALTTLVTLVLVYKAVGIIPTFVMAFLPFSIISMLTPYHTSPISLLFFLTYLLIVRHRPFCAGLFIGFLYQSHLLTFIYWPLWMFWVARYKLSSMRIALGFVLGILPFILAGPVQTFGIFVWIIKGLLFGFEVSAGVSTAYWQVLLPGGVWILGRVIKWFYAYRRGDGEK